MLLKAITICQPFASLIMLPSADARAKRVENRTWAPFGGMIGHRIAIHAGKALKWLKYWPEDEMPMSVEELPLGKIIGTAELAGCVRIADARAGKADEKWPWLSTHRHTSGPYCWILQDIRVLSNPITMSGAQGVWSVPDHLIRNAGWRCVD
jgi:hypothetical protein